MSSPSFFDRQRNLFLNGREILRPEQVFSDGKVDEPRDGVSSPPLIDLFVVPVLDRVGH